MIEVKGTYNTAKLFTDTADDATIAQVRNLMNQPSAKGAKVRIMPDCHARAGERLLIPINMRDGALICIGKGNDDWNQSSPHGAGRLMSRTEAKNSISMKEYKDYMSGIYTTSVNKGTLDESPMAYKPIDEIVANIEPTVEIVSHIKPIYNFKAGNEE